MQKINLSLLFALLGEKNSLDVGEDTTLSNGDTREELVQFLVVSDSELKMTGDDSALLVVSGSVSSQLENFSSEVLHDCSKIDWGTSTNSFSIVSLAEKSMDTTNRELKSGSAGSALCLSLHFSTLSTSRHD
jgi:hypothetical protein